MLASWVLPGRPAADIGCDHGLLLRELLRQGAIPSGIGVDLRPEPLARARANLVGLPVALRLGDGLDPLRPGEVATVVIAGMHGARMVDMVGRSQGKAERLVLGPHGGDALLRADLVGWRLIAEQVVEEAGQRYPLLIAEPGLEQRTQLYYGDPAVHRDLAQLRARAEGDRARLERLPRRTEASEARLAEALRVLAAA